MRLLKYKKLIFLFITLVLCSSCGAGDDSTPGGISDNPFLGTWKGIITQDADFDLLTSKLELEFDNLSKLTAYYEDDTPLTAAGSVEADSSFDKIHDFNFTIDGKSVEGSFILSVSEKYIALLIYNTGTYGILQKNLGVFQFEPASFSKADLTGAWLGKTLEVGADFSPASAYGSTMTVTTSTVEGVLASFTGTNLKYSFSGNINAFWDDIGIYRGVMSTGVTGGVIVAMSPDKQASLYVTCPKASISNYKILDASTCTYSLNEK